MGMAAERSAVDLSKVRTRQAALQRIRARHLRLPPGEWLVATGWDETAWGERRYLSAAELDAIAPARPVVAFRMCFHLATVSSTGLARLQLPPETQGVDRDPSTGRPTGILREQGVESVAKAVGASDAQCRAGLRQAIRLAHGLGLTTLCDLTHPLHLPVYQRAFDERWLKVRIVFGLSAEVLDAARSLGLQTGFGNRWLRVGPVKIFADGAIGARTAAVGEPFADDPGNRGALIRPPEELHRLMREAHAAGFQLAVHAIGDQGIEAVLDGIEAMFLTHQKRTARPRIEHFELPTRPQLRRAKRLGVMASMQPNFIGKWGLPGSMYDDRLGPERSATINPLRWVLDEGLTLAFGSDGMPLGPLYGLHWAVNAPYPSQRLTVDEALHAYTLGSAHALLEETHLGSLEPGKLADLVVLDRDLHDAPDQLKDLRVERVFVGGEEVHRRPKR